MSTTTTAKIAKMQTLYVLTEQQKREKKKKGLKHRKKKEIFVCSRSLWGACFSVGYTQSISNRMLEIVLKSHEKKKKKNNDTKYTYTTYTSWAHKMRDVFKWPSNSYVWLMTRCPQWFRLSNDYVCCTCSDFWIESKHKIDKNNNNTDTTFSDWNCLFRIPTLWLKCIVNCACRDNIKNIHIFHKTKSWIKYHQKQILRKRGSQTLSLYISFYLKQNCWWMIFIYFLIHIHKYIMNNLYVFDALWT